MIQLFKFLKGFEDISVESMFQFSTTRTRWHNLKLYKSRRNKIFRQNSFAVRVIDPWNSLSTNVVSAENVSEFKTQLDKEWRHLYRNNPKISDT